MKKDILLPILTIALAALVLFGAAFGLKGVAAENAQAEHLKLMQTLLPGSETFTAEAYAGDDANIRSVHKGENGFVIETVTYGYAGEITMYIGVSNEGKVTGLVVRELSETFGLGANALTDHVFLAQFLNSSGEFAVATSGADAFSGATGTVEESTGDTVDVDAITGATVTSKA
ncbi:MAG: FMN-binding protein, partial [Oscillospiraceae bacterium]|nr:FMN-binding protein [Oscillospiraceae bacterium]